MTIQFGGLATGLDTGNIVEQLMALERKPITLLEKDKTWLNSRLKAFTELDTKLKSFADAIKTLGDADTLLQRSAKLSSEDFLSATVSSDAQAGASYQVEVVALAQVQKSVSAGVASQTETSFGTGDLILTVGGKTKTIKIEPGDNSLDGIMRAINKAGFGVSAAIINTGTPKPPPDNPEPPYRLVLTGEDVGTDFSLDTSGLLGGASTLTIDETIQKATQAHIRVDNINIYSDSNTLSEAIPGVTLDLLQAKVGTTTNLNISVDRSSIKSTIEAFAKGYNEVMSFITSQSAINGSKGGVLGGDSGVSAIKRRLQNMLTQPFANSGVFTTLSELGFETQKDGSLVVNNKKLSAAVDSNLDSIVSLLAGEGGGKGIAAQFQDYLKSMTSTATGMLKGRKEGIDSNLRRIDNRISFMEMRLEKRQKMLEAQFGAMESLVSGLNAQSAYLNQQMTMLSNMMSGGNQ